MSKSSRFSLAAVGVALCISSVAAAQTARPAAGPNARDAKPSARPDTRPAKPTPPPAAPAAPVAKPGPANPAGKPALADALKLKPIQPDVDYDQPDAQAAQRCVLNSIKAPSVSGWEVRTGDGDLLRRFLDTNGDNKLDQWCYYQDGVEVYRDLDSDYDQRVDQYRWLGTAGIRWGLDMDQDGHIDHWKAISAEEVSEEIIAALSTRDGDRLRRLLLTDEELQGLGLGAARADELGKRIADSAAGLDSFVASQDFVTRETRWVNFGATRPGIVPAGTDGLERDLQVYENAVAVTETDGSHDQIIIGTMIRTGDAWRIVTLPHSLSDSPVVAASDGFFFHGPLVQRGAGELSIGGGLSKDVQELIGALEQIDRDLVAAATPDAIGPLNAQKADVLEKLVKSVTTPEDKAMWVRQLADTLSASVQVGGMPGTLERLEALSNELQATHAAPELAAYVRFVFLSADYSQAMQQPSADPAKIQEKWLADLEQFVQDFPATEDTAEAMLQLAFAEEFLGHDEKAINWYTRITSEFPESPRAAKAAGATRRMQCVGQTLTFSGKDTQGNPVNLAALRGKAVVIHYWATWCGPCRQDISVLKDMQAKYGKENVAILGVNVDNAAEDFQAYLAQNSIPWPQIHEPGGLDSAPANALGILTLPTMLLIDRDGKVVNRNLRGEEIDQSLGKLVR